MLRFSTLPISPLLHLFLYPLFMFVISLDSSTYRRCRRATWGGLSSFVSNCSRPFVRSARGIARRTDRRRKLASEESRHFGVRWRGNWWMAVDGEVRAFRADSELQSWHVGERERRLPGILLGNPATFIYKQPWGHHLQAAWRRCGIVCNCSTRPSTSWMKASTTSHGWPKYSRLHG
jgi:hypothetical protein